MSLDSLPDEVLVKILYKPFVNDDPITTSVEAHDIYEAYLVSLDQEQAEDCFTRVPMRGFTKRRPVLSALLLGVCKRWYRLGCPLFYGHNVFILMYYDFAAFAKQIGVHNSMFLRGIDLTVHHQDPSPGETVSLVSKTLLGHVKTFSVILARREKRVLQGHAQWRMMRDKIFNLGKAIHTCAISSGGQWDILEPGLPIVYTADGFSVWSAFWVLQRTSTPSKVYTKNKPLNTTALTRSEDAVKDEPTVPKGGSDGIPRVKGTW